jgi:hypothetical protein
MEEEFSSKNGFIKGFGAVNEIGEFSRRDFDVI